MTHSFTIVLVVVNVCTISLTNCTQGPLCFSCQDEVKPSTCAIVVRCGIHEVCSLERGQNLMGETVFWSGCKDKTSCSGRKRSSSPPDVSVDCDVCCNGDFCNQQGCGEQVYHKHQNEGPICLHCGTINNPAACPIVKRCRSDELCSIETSLHDGKTAYHQGCRNSSSCVALNNVGTCNTCCKADFCNRECSDGFKTTTRGQSSSSNIQATPSKPTASPTSVGQTTTHKPVWASVTPQGIQRLKCYECQNVRSIGPECMERKCAANEKCFIEQGIGIGNVFSMGCRREEFCSRNVFGKRESIRGAVCCSYDMCNLQLYQSYTSPNSTSSTSSFPSTTNSHQGFQWSPNAKLH